MTRVLASALLLTLTGCAAGKGPAERSCTSDAECVGPGEVCFLSGCADPGQGVVAEVAGDPLAGQYAQDFAFDAGVTANMSFELRGPLSLTGELLRERTANVDPSNRIAYTAAVLVRATGESELVPGLARSFEARFDSTLRGEYAMSVGAGKYNVIALPADTTVPPEIRPSVSIAGGEQLLAKTVNFAFPSIDGAVTMTGRLIKKRVSVTPPVEVALTQVAMDLQAFDPLSRLPLSQRVQVASGTAGSKGEYTLYMSPTARELPSILIIASPREAGSLVPSKSFTVTAPLPSAMTFELGDFGESLPQVAGTISPSGEHVLPKILSSDGLPVAGALVLIEGEVTGGGKFRSKIVTTDATGSFAVDLLANSSTGPFTMQIVPPPESRAAATQVPVKVVVKTGSATLDPPVVTLGDRLLVSGTVHQPDGQVARAVHVSAVEKLSAEGRELPLEDVNTATDLDGKFTLRLDPGTWTLEFIPGADLPRTSRVVTINANQGVAGAVELGDLPLSKGRRVSGQVTASSALRNSAVVPYATVRFFHVEGRSAVLMATGTTDEKGTYSVILPTR